MQNFSIKVPEQLFEKLDVFLRERGLTRSGFVRELIERELRSGQDGTAVDLVTQHPITRFKGIIKGRKHSRDDALRVDEILLDEGYGADGADS